MFEEIMKNIKEKKPLVHCITNYVTVNDCANIILASGGSPIMADDINEAEEITSVCDSLVINIGTLNERTIESMIKAGKKANELGHPVILDPVGAGASGLRSRTVSRLLEEIRFSVIRGNISEIKSVYSGVNTARGVDADALDLVGESSLESAADLAVKMSEKTGAVIVITGETDIVSDSRKTYIIKNGHPLMAGITGSGCMLSAMTGACCAANSGNVLDSAACAAAVMGISGEKAFIETEKSGYGISSFRTFLIDWIGKMNTGLLNEAVKIESR